jgi:hypothetical protein
METILFMWFSRKVLHVWDGGLLRRTYVLAHAGLADVDAKLQQFAVNPRGTPERIVAAHRTNQGADFLRHRRSSRLAAPNLPSPKQAKALSMPAYDARSFDEEDIPSPIVQTVHSPAHRNRSARVSLGRFTER